MVMQVRKVDDEGQIVQLARCGSCLRVEKESRRVLFVRGRVWKTLALSQREVK